MKPHNTSDGVASGTFAEIFHPDGNYSLFGVDIGGNPWVYRYRRVKIRGGTTSRRQWRSVRAESLAKAYQTAKAPYPQ